MGYAEEFQTIDLIVQSPARTRGVDAFALSLIKAERQIRRLVTHLVFQYPCFTSHDTTRLRETLGNNRKVYFEGFVRGFDAISDRSIGDLIGPKYHDLRSKIDRAISYRNKIFHGQLTSDYLSRTELLEFASNIRCWCELLAKNAETHMGYDGFSRDSLQKSKRLDIANRFKMQIQDIDGYRRFIIDYMQRQPNNE